MEQNTLYGADHGRFISFKMISHGILSSKINNDILIVLLFEPEIDVSVDLINDASGSTFLKANPSLLLLITRCVFSFADFRMACG